jgi:hypothetical protein
MDTTCSERCRSQAVRTRSPHALGRREVRSFRGGVSALTATFSLKAKVEYRTSAADNIARAQEPGSEIESGEV